MSESSLLLADWPAPENIRAFTSTRDGGNSQAPYDSLNLGDHVGDDVTTVNQNRESLYQLAQLPTPPLWLNQVHGVEAIHSDKWKAGVKADATFTHQKKHVCAILTADCLPILLCDQSGHEVAAIHAGWRGLLNGIIENTVQQLHSAPKQILAWLGPAIGPQQFEVGGEVFKAFTEQEAAAKTAFTQTDDNHYLANIYQLARQRLHKIGVSQIYGGQHCTVSEPSSFFSYRRDHITGRMASIIWIADK